MPGGCPGGMLNFRIDRRLIVSRDKTFVEDEITKITKNIGFEEEVDGIKITSKSAFKFDGFGLNRNARQNTKIEN